MADNFRIYKNERKKERQNRFRRPLTESIRDLCFSIFFLESIVFFEPVVSLEPIGRQFGESLLVLPFSFEVAVHRIVVEPKADEVFGN